jgi:uncharacterized membrane protein
MPRIPVLAIAAGALAGFRTMSALAAAGHAVAGARRSSSPALLGLFSSSPALSVLDTLAAGEMVADKTPSIPDRIAPVPFVGRTIAGALAAGMVAVHLDEPPGPWAAAGAAAAAVATVASYRLRRASSPALSNVGAGLVEDAIVVGAGWILALAVAGAGTAAMPARS